MRKLLAAVTIFLGSFLLFGVQPMVGRTLLPAFGGTASVWIVCLCTFQALLPAGYLYAHLMAGRRWLYGVHVGLLLLAAVLTTGVAAWRYSFLDLALTGVPVLDVLVCVAAFAGLPYVVLSANVSLVSSSVGGSGAYRLYAVSNAGSLAGLLAYPFVMEPFLGVGAQWKMFACGLALYAVLVGMVIFRRASGMTEEENMEIVSVEGGREHNFAIEWLLLPAVSCFLLNALTTHLTTDIMPLPLIWTITLAVFLLSYVVGFSGVAERFTGLFAWTAAACGIVAVGLSGKAWGKEVDFKVVFGCYMGLLFFGCSFIHSWLYRTRPTAAGLTSYYLCGAVGGAAGGLLSGLLFPLVSRGVAEFPLSLALMAVALLCYIRRSFKRLLAAGVAIAAGTCTFIFHANSQSDRPLVFAARGFFGVVKVTEAKARVKAGEGVLREYVHGTTVHGIQALLPGRERMTTTYYTPNGCGYAVIAHPKYRNGEPMRVCLVGLGLGVYYAYAREGDYYRGYEIAKEVMSMATTTNLFTFISGCPARHEEILTDARKGLEGELACGGEKYDVILVDAFSGDSQPYHISTFEAFELYFKMLKPDGVLAVNISNRHLQLEPFMKKVGEVFNVPLLGMECRDNFALLQFSTKAAFFCRQPEGLSNPPAECRMIDFTRFKAMERLPTDEKGSFISLVRW